VAPLDSTPVTAIGATPAQLPADATPTPTELAPASGDAGAPAARTDATPANLATARATDVPAVTIDGTPAIQPPMSIDAFEVFTAVRPQPVAPDTWSTDQMSTAPAPVRRHRLRVALVAAACCAAIGAAGWAAAVHYLG
jgi:hypothetical protein